MMYAGVLESVSPAWRMKPLHAGMIQTAFSLSYRASLIAGAILTDRLGARRILLWSSGLSAFVAAAVASLAVSEVAGLILFTALGLALGGSYASSLVLVVQNIRHRWRGLGIDSFLAASSAGYLGSVQLSGIVQARLGYRAELLAYAVGPLVALAAAWYGLCSCPNIAHERSQTFITVPKSANRCALLVTMGYAAHCWELPSLWAWPSAFWGSAPRSGSVAARGLLSAVTIHGAGGLASLTTICPVLLPAERSTIARDSETEIA
jgi:predicted MFS family arabinose efflux permease